MNAASALPPWRDEALVNEAQQFFLLYGLASSTLLACASLPQCYVMKYGTEVLAYTKFLQVDPTRRVRETAQMVMDVMVPGGLTPRGRGVRATMKVRVMHAIVRHMIQHDRAPFANPRSRAAREVRPADQPGRYGLHPDDLLVRGHRGLPDDGIRHDRRQREGYIHCWNVVGYLMGIREALLPASFADAAALFDAIQRASTANLPPDRS